MIIRSKDKKSIINLDNIDTIVIKEVIDCIHIQYFSGGGIETMGLLGTYSTEEKAIKVLDMIQDAYLSRMELDGGYDVIHGCYVQPNFWVLPRLFQMPQDDEV